MASSKRETRYLLVSSDADNEKDSDATSDSSGDLGRALSWQEDGTSLAILRTKTAKRQVILTWVRWTTVVSLQMVVVLLLLLRKEEGLKDGPSSSSIVETGSDINGLYRTLSHTYTILSPEMDIYMPNMTSDENRLEVRRNWDLLMPLGSGSVAIPDWRKHPLLGEPITDDPIRSGPLFEASWTHALHCLYYSVDTYHQLIVHGRTGKEDPYHASHCFEYLRNSILCNLDMTLEGSVSTKRGGEGQAHVCRNREEAITWIEERRVDDLQDIVGP